MEDKAMLTHMAPMQPEALSASANKSADEKLASAGSVFHVHNVSKTYRICRGCGSGNFLRLVSGAQGFSSQAN